MILIIMHDHARVWSALQYQPEPRRRLFHIRIRFGRIILVHTPLWNGASCARENRNEDIGSNLVRELILTAPLHSIPIGEVVHIFFCYMYYQLELQIDNQPLYGSQREQLHSLRIFLFLYKDY